jgi:hypothetical protein
VRSCGKVCEYAVSFNSNGTRESPHLFPHNATINYFLFSAEAGLAKLAVNGCSSGQRWYPVSLINLDLCIYVILQKYEIYNNW